MPRFYFDHRGPGGIERDPDGLELADLSEALRQAQLALAEQALSAAIGQPHTYLAIEIREGEKEAVLTVVSTTSVVHLTFGGKPPAPSL